LSEIEKDYILDTVGSNGGNRREAALELGIGLATLHRKLKSYGAQPKAPSSGITPSAPEDAEE
jgi:DNA-binding NtrC family response regulator